MAQVILKTLSKTFKEVAAVRDMDLQIEDGEFLVLVGPSGCGKTTALRMIAGLEEPTGGQIYIGDRMVNDVEPKDRDIAMVFQNYALYPHMSVYRNMAFGLEQRRMRKTDIKDRVEKAAEMLGLADLLARKPKQLSGGQRQRVALGRAIVREPKVFLMDEPLSNLDAKLRVQTRAELIKLHRKLGITTVYVTHDQLEAMTMGDRIVVMNHGLVQQVDAPLNLYNHPTNMFVAGFIGSPAMNFVRARVEGDARLRITSPGLSLEVPEDRTEALSPWAGREVVFGIRPEDIFDAGLSPTVAIAAGNTVTASVDVIEPMGPTVTAYLTCGADSIVATVDAQSPVSSAKPGESVPFVFDMSRAHVFDPTTEQAVA